jgi:hypothetical protein
MGKREQAAKTSPHLPPEGRDKSGPYTRAMNRTRNTLNRSFSYDTCTFLMNSMLRITLHLDISLFTHIENLLPSHKNQTYQAFLAIYCPSVGTRFYRVLRVGLGGATCQPQETASFLILTY